MARWTTVLGVLATQLGCGAVTVRVVRGPALEEAVTWSYETTYVGSPAILGPSAHWNALSGLVPDLNHARGETRYANNTATVQVSRRSGLFVLSSLVIQGVGLGEAEPPLPMSDVPFVQLRRVVEGSTLRISGPEWLMRPQALPDGVDTLQFEIDTTPIARTRLRWDLERHGWEWSGNAWVSASGVQLSGDALSCIPGEALTLWLDREDRHEAPWSLWHLKGRAPIGGGLIASPQWPKWLEQGPHALLLDSTGPTAELACPELHEGDGLALVTRGTHPDFVFVQLLEFRSR